MPALGASQLQPTKRRVAPASKAPVRIVPRRPAPRRAPVKARPAPKRPTKARRPASPRQRAIALVKLRLKAFVVARQKQPNHTPPRPFPVKEKRRWQGFLGTIEAHMTRLPPPLLQQLRTVLENESDRDRNRFSNLPEALSNRVIRCMSALGLRIGLFKRPRPVRARPRRVPKKKKKAPRVPDPSELPPLVFTQKDLERFKPPVTKLGWPIAGGKIGSGFGWRRDPFTRRRSFHGAVDIGAAYGTPVYAAEGGLVVRTGWMGKCGMGVVLQHGPKMRTYYCHLSQILAPSGKVVKRGQRIGSVGNSGRSTSPHLHFVVSLNGRAVNPADYLK